MYTYTTAVLPERMKMAREYKSLNQSDIAKELGISTTSYGKWELGKRNLNADKLAVVANLLRIDLNFFFVEKMTLEEADLDIKEREKPIELMAKRLEALEKKLMPKKKMDPIAERVVIYAPLRELVELVQFWEGGILKSFKDMAYAYIAGISYSKRFQSRERIGEGLVRIGALKPKERDRVLRVQQEKYNEGKTFGEIAVEMKFVDQNIIDDFLDGGGSKRRGM